MRSVLSFIFVFLISAAGQTALSAVSDEKLYDDIYSLYSWDNPELFNNDCRNTPIITIDKHSVTEKSYLYDDCVFNPQPAIALLPYDHAGTKRPDFFNYNRTKLQSTGSGPIYARAEISNIDSGKNDSLSNNFYDKVVFWIKDAYHAWVAKDHYGSTRLLLLSFGLVGIVGVRRKSKKD